MTRPSSLTVEVNRTSADDRSAVALLNAGHRIGLWAVVFGVLLFSSCGGSLSAPSHSASPSDPPAHTTGTTMTNLQAKAGWKGFGELAPAYVPCTSCSPQVTWKMTQTSSAAQFDIGGTVPYSDVLWSNAVIGQGSTQGVADSNETLVPTLKNFTYDAWFLSNNLPASQALEFDVSQYLNGKSFIWGHQCRIAGGHEWDIWDNINNDWVSTGIACNPVNGEWNHVVIQMQRTSDNRLLFQSITLNDVTGVLNQTYSPGSVPSGWYGITLHFQMDGDYKQTPHTVSLDRLSFTYW